MFKDWRIWAIILSSLCLFGGCSKSTRNESKKEILLPSSTDFTPKEDEEAELMALCLSGELVAPDSLYEQISNDLRDIRDAFGDTFQIIARIEFFPPWMAGQLMMSFEDSVVQQIRNGEYHAWDELNQEYQVVDIDTGLIDFIGLVVLTFNGRLHPWRLAELYEKLPGVRYASPNFIYGDRPNVYARETGGGLSYLFRNGWGDCPAGCIYNEYWYFIFAGNQPAFVGYWSPHQQSEPPDWWGEARLNKEHYCD